MDPRDYEAWYDTPRGRWIGAREFEVLHGLVAPPPAASILDVGCGSGYFARRFARSGHPVIGLDPALPMLRFVREHPASLPGVAARAEALPFADAAFDYCLALTSLCFVGDPLPAMAEMLRVARRGVVLGLLNRHSRLFAEKFGHSGYRGARWDSVGAPADWCAALGESCVVTWRTAIFLPRGGPLSRGFERILPGGLPFGGFIAAVVRREV